MKPKTKALSAWRCFKCGSWNKYHEPECKNCKAPVESFDAVQLQHDLTQEESMFYTGTAPEMLRALRSMNIRLQSIEAIMREAKAKDVQ